MTMIKKMKSPIVGQLKACSSIFFYKDLHGAEVGSNKF